MRDATPAHVLGTREIARQVYSILTNNKDRPDAIHPFAHVYHYFLGHAVPLGEGQLVRVSADALVSGYLAWAQQNPMVQQELMTPERVLAYFDRLAHGSGGVIRPVYDPPDASDRRLVAISSRNGLSTTAVSPAEYARRKQSVVDMLAPTFAPQQSAGVDTVIGIMAGAMRPKKRFTTMECETDEEQENAPHQARRR